jgi:hypothetical protein
LRDSRFKFINGRCPELFDVVADPFERRNVYGDNRRVARAMAKSVDAVASTSPPLDLRPPPVPEELRRRLDALGYVANAADVDGIGDRTCEKRQPLSETFQEGRKIR